MKVYYDLQSLPRFQHAVVTIGTFDGVHVGHAKIINQLVNYAASIQGESVVITFSPHPRTLLQPQQPVALLTSNHEKINLLAAKGVQHLVIVQFTQEFANQSADAYIKDFLVNSFHPHTIIIGYDHKFGKDRAGDISLLQQATKQYHFQVKEIEAELIDEITISSTKIRQALLQGQIHIANTYLGYRYTLHGTVVEGQKLAGTWGIPTANLQIDFEHKLIPKYGVYAVEVVVNETIHYAVANIGLRPSVTKDSKPSVEVHIFDFNENLYGQNLSIQLVHFLRAEQKFNSVNELVTQIKSDIHEAKKYFLLSSN